MYQIYRYDLQRKIMTMSISRTPKSKNQRTPLYTHALNLLTLRHLSPLPLGSAKLKALIVPALGANLVQGLLAVTVERRTILATAVPRLNGFNETGIVAVQQITLQIVPVLLLREGECAELGVGPSSTYPPWISRASFDT